MSVIFIGDRRVGKTTLAVELAKPGGSNSFIQVIEPTYKELTDTLYAKSQASAGTKSIFKAAATARIGIKQFKIRVQLPNVNRTLTIKWVDTPGEFWKEPLSEEQNNSDEWQELLSKLQAAQGIMLVLAPPRYMLKEQYLQEARESISTEDERFLDSDSWTKIFEAWLNFMSTHIRPSQHVLICLNMADLFCDYKAETEQLRYAPSGQELMSWQQRNEYVLNNYFEEVKNTINRYNQTTNGNLLQTLITTKESRILLELPWLYLGHHLRREPING